MTKETPAQRNHRLTSCAHNNYRIMLPSTLCSTSMLVTTREEKPCDYLHDALVAPSQRTEAVDWMYIVVDKYGLDPEVVVAAMGTVDRFLSTPSSIAQGALRDRRQFELVAVAALALCLWTGERTPPKREVLAAVSRDAYTAKEIQDMASHIRRSLSPGRAPTSTQMARHFLSLALPGVTLEDSRWTCVLDDVRFQTEHAARDHFFATQQPRTVAMAAILNALDQVTGRDRLEVLRVFPLIVKEHFPSLGQVLASRNKLRAVMKRDDDTAVSDIILKILDGPPAEEFVFGVQEAPLSLESVNFLPASMVSPSK